MGKRRRTEIAKIADPAARLVTYSKRRKGLFSKASALCRLCDARVAVIVFSQAGKLCSFGDPSVDEIMADYLRDGDGDGDGNGDGDATPPMGLTQWMDWMEAEREACTTEEGFESLILKYEAVQDLVRNKLKSMEDESKVKVGEVSAGESHMLTEEEMDALFDSLSRCPALSDLMTDGDGDGIPPQNSDGGGSVAMESIPALSVGGGSSGVASAPTSAGLEDQGFDPDELLNLLEDGDHEDDGFEPSNLLEDGDHEDDGFDPDEFLILLEDGDMDGGRKGSSTSPEDSAVVGCGYNPDDFVGLGDLDVLL